MNKLNTYFLVILLSACSSKPEYHNSKYYELHPDETKQVLDYCRKQDKDLVKVFRNDQNCLNAAVAQYVINLARVRKHTKASVGK